ncbi:MAG: hypothetical protein JWQ96_1259 [Segetibacter sp.]|nr:hypothetical protein [Segetibacter sp.]
MSNSPTHFPTEESISDSTIPIPETLKQSLNPQQPATYDVPGSDYQSEGNGYEAATATPDGFDDSGALLPVPPIIIIAKNQVYGSYKGVLASFELELRVDIDGPKPLNKLSGDFYSISGSTKTYFGSFIVATISKTIVGGIITVQGIAQTTWSTPFNKVKVTIPQTSIFNPLAPATLQWSNPITGAIGGTYICNYGKRGFRTVRVEQDYTSGVVPFTSHNTATLPSGGPARVLSVNSAYAEAGVEMNNLAMANMVPIALAGADAKWTNAELHNAMVGHFSVYQNNPAWDVWLLHAYEHVDGAGLYGIMFDQQGLHRQGCAVFYRGIGGSSALQRRLQLYTCVHELGHCFNLLHSWQKSYATPAKPNIPASLSWMNYPWYYTGGADNFWNNFPFQFDSVEIEHIRHGFRNNVIMGGNNFATGASLEHDVSIFQDSIEDRSNLLLEIETKSSYLLGEPVVLETKLKTTTTLNRRVNASLHTDYGFVHVAIKKPGGQVVVYEPIGEKCIVPEVAVLNSKNQGVYQSSYIGFHKEGFIFDQVGSYELKAVYFDEDGSRIVSAPITLRVKGPVTGEDDKVADLMMQEEVGYLLAFMGSDAEYLSNGNDALAIVAEDHKSHPLSVYAQFVLGVNAQRTFKTITPDKEVEVREPDFSESIPLLKEVVEKSKAGEGLDNISLNQTMEILAKAYQRDGMEEAAQSTVEDIINHFNEQPIKQSVKDSIAIKAVSILSEK